MCSNFRGTYAVPGLFETSHMKFNYENKQEGSPDPTLEEMTEKAIGVLNKGDDGFMLMVEGELLDFSIT